MVNYLYDIAAIEANHEAFVRDFTIIRSEEVAALMAEPVLRPRRRFAGLAPARP
jgi:hypothetical protein